MNKHDLEVILQTQGLTPLKKFGQNFLLDEQIITKIISPVIGDSSEEIIEVGPGLGALTKGLALSNKRIVAVEIDKGLSSYIANNFPRVEVLHMDFLKYKFSEAKLSVISNIPYYLTTAIIEKIVIEPKKLVQFIFMVQKEVRERLFAKPGSKLYGPLAILLSLAGKLSDFVNVPRGCFYPAPHVDSAVFIFIPQQHDLQLDKFYRFICRLFLTRRKTMLNNLSTLTNDKEKAMLLLNTCGITLNLRPEQLEPERFVQLFTQYQKDIENF